MIKSPNLNVITKALDKVSAKMARDFGELENLQSNNFASAKFANATYISIKEKLAKELLEARPDFNIRFLDGEEIINKKNAKATFVILPIDGLLNFSRALTSFSNIVALEEENDGKKEITAIAISNIAGNELCYASKGGGAFLNNRRIRIASHKPLNNILCAISDKNLFKNKILDDKKYILSLSNCSSLDLVNLAASKINLAVFSTNNQEILKIATILIKEAGGFVKNSEGVFLVGNNKIIG